MNWRCSRDDAAETAAATAAVDAAAGLATAPGLASPVVSSPTEEIQVKCERSSTLTFFYLLSCVYLTLSAKQIRHGYPLILEGFPLSGSGSWIGIILFNWCDAWRLGQAAHLRTAALTPSLSAVVLLGRRARSSTGRSRRRRSTFGAG